MPDKANFCRNNGPYFKKITMYGVKSTDSGRFDSLKTRPKACIIIITVICYILIEKKQSTREVLYRLRWQTNSARQERQETLWNNKL